MGEELAPDRRIGLVVAQRVEAFSLADAAKVAEAQSRPATIACANQQPRGQGTRDSPVAIGERVQAGQMRHDIRGANRRRCP